MSGNQKKIYIAGVLTPLVTNLGETWPLHSLYLFPCQLTILIDNFYLQSKKFHLADNMVGAMLETALLIGDH